MVIAGLGRAGMLRTEVRAQSHPMSSTCSVLSIARDEGKGGQSKLQSNSVRESETWYNCCGRMQQHHFFIKRHLFSSSGMTSMSNGVSNFGLFRLTASSSINVQFKAVLRALAGAPDRASETQFCGPYYGDSLLVSLRLFGGVWPVIRASLSHIKGSLSIAAFLRSIVNHVAVTSRVPRTAAALPQITFFGIQRIYMQNPIAIFPFQVFLFISIFHSAQTDVKQRNSIKSKEHRELTP
jgi:hypothetical protein